MQMLLKSPCLIFTSFKSLQSTSQNNGMDEDEAPQSAVINSPTPAHSLAMACVPLMECTSDSSQTDLQAATNDDNKREIPKDVKKKSFGSFWKRKSDKGKDKKKNKFFQSSGKKRQCVQTKSADRSVSPIPSVTSGLDTSDNNNDHNCMSNFASIDIGPATHAVGAMPHQANRVLAGTCTDTAKPDDTVTGATSGLSSAAVSARSPAGNAAGFSLRQIVPVPSEALDENIRREMESSSWRGHVAYPHLHYPSSSRSNGSNPGPSDATANLTDNFRQQCSMSAPHYPGANGGSQLRTFARVSLDDRPPPPPPPATHLLAPPRSQAPVIARTEVTQVDYAHYLVPDLLEISRCGFYWGIMDRYEAERLLDNKPEGTFLLRDSAQEEFLFSVSFRRYGRSLHARIDQWNHRFSFDTHDSGVFGADSVTGLIEHYKDPSCCMFFEPMLTIPLNRNYPFSLQHLSRAAICKHSTYDGMNLLPLPKPLIEYLKYYHYKLVVNRRKVELPMQQTLSR